MPSGDGTTLEAILKELTQEKFYLDGTIRPVQRSIDHELQKESRAACRYTGKRCTHVYSRSQNDLLNDKIAESGG